MFPFEAQTLYQVQIAPGKLRTDHFSFLISQFTHFRHDKVKRVGNGKHRLRTSAGAARTQVLTCGTAKLRSDSRRGRSPRRPRAEGARLPQKKSRSPNSVFGRAVSACAGGSARPAATRPPNGRRPPVELPRGRGREPRAGGRSRRRHGSNSAASSSSGTGGRSSHAGSRARARGARAVPPPPRAPALEDHRPLRIRKSRGRVALVKHDVAAPPPSSRSTPRARPRRRAACSSARSGVRGGRDGRTIWSRTNHSASLPMYRRRTPRIRPRALVVARSLAPPNFEFRRISNFQRPSESRASRTTQPAIQVGKLQHPPALSSDAASSSTFCPRRGGPRRAAARRPGRLRARA